MELLNLDIVQIKQRMHDTAYLCLQTGDRLLEINITKEVGELT